MHLHSKFWAEGLKCVKMGCILFGACNLGLRFRPGCCYKLGFRAWGLLGLRLGLRSTILRRNTKKTDCLGMVWLCQIGCA